MNGTKKARLLHYNRLEQFDRDKHLSLWGYSYITKKMKCCKCWPKNHVYITLFYYQLTNRPNKQEYYITLGWKGLPGTNTSAYWAIHKLLRKWSVVNTDPLTTFAILYFLHNLWMEPKKLDCYITLGRNGFLGTNVSAYGVIHKLRRNKVLWRLTQIFKYLKNNKNTSLWVE